MDSQTKRLFVTSPQQAQIVNELKRFLEFHFRNPLTSADISSHLKYDYAYLSRLFRQATRMTITDYIHHLRIDEARVLLLEMNEHESIREVAHFVGYSNPSYFSRIFRKLEGVSPTDYIRNAYLNVS